MLLPALLLALLVEARRNSRNTAIKLLIATSLGVYNLYCYDSRFCAPKYGLVSPKPK
jgi:hypothetical protein